MSCSGTLLRECARCRGDGVVPEDDDGYASVDVDSCPDCEGEGYGDCPGCYDCDTTTELGGEGGCA